MAWDSCRPSTQSGALLTAIDVLAVPILARQTTSLVAQGVHLSRRELRLVLELAEFAVFAVAAEVPVVAHLLAGTLHALVEGESGAVIARWEWLIESLLFFVVIGIFLLFVLRSWRNGDIAVGRDTGLADSS